MITEYLCSVGDLVILWLPPLANMWLKATLFQRVFMKQLLTYCRVCNHFHQLTLLLVFGMYYLVADFF